MKCRILFSGKKTKKKKTISNCYLLEKKSKFRLLEIFRSMLSVKKKP